MPEVPVAGLALLQPALGLAGTLPPEPALPLPEPALPLPEPALPAAPPCAAPAAPVVPPVAAPAPDVPARLCPSSPLPPVPARAPAAPPLLPATGGLPATPDPEGEPALATPAEPACGVEGDGESLPQAASVKEPRSNAAQLASTVFCISFVSYLRVIDCRAIRYVKHCRRQLRNVGESGFPFANMICGTRTCVAAGHVGDSLEDSALG